MMTTGRSPRSRGGWGWLLAALAFALVVLFSTPLGSLLRGAFANAVNLGPSDPEYDSLSRNELVSRLKTAEAELKNIGYQSVLYSALAEENASLKKASSVQSFEKAVTARVIMRPPRTLYDTLLLDSGAESGISEGDVVAFNGVALGTVISADPTTSLVRLYSTPQAETDVTLGTPRAIAVAKGVGGGAFELSLPKDVALSKNEPVVLPNSQTLVLGFVVTSKSSPSDASATVYVRSPVSMNELDYVSVFPHQGL